MDEDITYLEALKTLRKLGTDDFYISIFLMFWLPFVFTFFMVLSIEVRLWWSGLPYVDAFALYLKIPILVFHTLVFPFLIGAGAAFYELYDFRRTLIKNRAYLKWAQEQSRKICEARQKKKEDDQASS